MFICLNLNSIGNFHSFDFLYCSQFLLQICSVKSLEAFTSKAICIGLWASIVPNYCQNMPYWIRAPDFASCPAFPDQKALCSFAYWVNTTHLLGCIVDHLPLHLANFSQDSPRRIIHRFFWGSPSPCGFCLGSYNNITLDVYKFASSYQL